MKKLSVLCFFVFLIPALGCIGSTSVEHILLTNLSDVTTQTDEDTLSAIVFTLLEATTGAEIDTEIEESGEGVIRYGFGYDPRILQQAEDQLPSGFLDSLDCDSATNLLLEGAPQNAILTEVERGAEVWCIAQIPFENILQLIDNYQALLQPITKAGGQARETASQAPLIDVRCLELVDGIFYQDLLINQNAVKPKDVELLDVFGIDVRWQVSMTGAIHSHNSVDQDTSLLSWNLLDPPEQLAVNVNANDACPSARVRLMVEFTATDTTLATLTIPITRRADDYLQNEAVRQRLSQQGWVTKIEGSANHAPRIVAVRQFERDELPSVVSAIPGVEVLTHTVEINSPPSVLAIETDSSATNSSEDSSNLDSSGPRNGAAAFDIELDLSSFSNTWSLLMPAQAPTAFELTVNAMQPLATSDEEWTHPAMPLLLWNGSADSDAQNLNFALAEESAMLLALDANEDADADQTDTQDPEDSLAISPESEDFASDDASSALPTRATGVLGPQNPSRVAGLPSPTSSSTPLPTSTPRPTATPLPSSSSTLESTPTSLSATSTARDVQTDATVAANTDTTMDVDSGAERSVALRPSIGGRSLEDEEIAASESADIADSSVGSAAEPDSTQTVERLIESVPVTSNDEPENDDSESSDPESAPIATNADAASSSEESDAALALKVADLLGDSTEPDADDSAEEDIAEDDMGEPGATETETSEAALVQNGALSTAESSLPACQVVIEWLNLRPGPGFEYGDPIAALPQNTDLLVVGQGPWGAWIEVIAAETLERGWVSLSPEFVLCEDDLTDVPTVDFATLSVPAAPLSADGSTSESVDNQESSAERATSEVNAVPAGN